MTPQPGLPPHPVSPQGGVRATMGERAARVRQRVRAPGVRGESGQASLIALLVSVALIGLLVWVFFFRHNGNRPSEKEELAHNAMVHSDKKTTLGAAEDQAKAVECKNNLDQIRQAIVMDRQMDEGTPPPQSLQSVHGLPDSMKACPVSGRPYIYDPRTGQVHCVTPGHERL